MAKTVPSKKAVSRRGVLGPPEGVAHLFLGAVRISRKVSSPAAGASTVRIVAG